MRCYVINLRRATQRLSHMEEEFAHAGLVMVRVEAIEAENASALAASQEIPQMRVRPWGLTELACLLSHREVWRRVAEHEDEFAAVFEDDLVLDRRIGQVLASFAGYPDGADIIKVETTDQAVWLSRRVWAGPDGCVYRRLFSLHHGTGAYILSRRAARLLLRSGRSLDMPVDDILFSQDHQIGRRMKTFQIVPALAVQTTVLPALRNWRHFPSDIEPERQAMAAVFKWKLPHKQWPGLRRLIGPTQKAIGDVRRRLFLAESVVPFVGRPELEDRRT